MTDTTNALLEEVLEAHGGIERWRQFSKVAAHVVTGGFLWGMKGIAMDRMTRTISSEFRRQWTRTEPFGSPCWRMTSVPERVVIESRAGQLIAAQDKPRETFAGHTWETQWTPLQLGYFNSYAMWTYYNVPFVLSEPGYDVFDIPAIKHGGALLRGLRVRFPKHIHTHCPEQDLFFDDEGLLRRHHYQVDVAGKSKAAHMMSDYVDVQGLRFPTKHRVFVRAEDNTPQLDKMTVSADLSDFVLS